MEQQSEMHAKLVEVLKKQKKKVHHIALDFILFNGNIHLKSFRLFEFDEKENVIKGMTMQEEYSYLREHREPVYGYFNLNEIKILEVSISNYLFLRESIHGAYAV